MRQKSFLMLAGITGVSILAAAATLFGNSQPPAFAESGERLFPGLETDAQTVTKLDIRDSAFDMTIALRDGTFVDAASGFPVDPEPLRELISGMTLAEIAEAKTSDPTRHADLQLAAVGAGTGAGSEVILYDDAGAQIAHVIAGQRDFTLGGVTGGQYVRRGGEDASWLVHARLDPPSRRSGWFDTRLMEVDAAEITSVSLTTPEGQIIAMTGEDGQLSIDPLLMEGRAPADNQIDRIVRLFETLDFSDVKTAGSLEEPKPGASIQSGLADGTIVTLSHMTAIDEADDAVWVQVEASGDTQIAEALNATAQGFAFLLSNSDADVLGWSIEDLTVEEAS